MGMKGPQDCCPPPDSFASEVLMDSYYWSLKTPQDFLYTPSFCLYYFELGFCSSQPKEFSLWKSREIQRWVCPGHNARWGECCSGRAHGRGSGLWIIEGGTGKLETKCPTEDTKKNGSAILPGKVVRKSYLGSLASERSFSLGHSPQTLVFLFWLKSVRLDTIPWWINMSLCGLHTRNHIAICKEWM